MRQREWSVLTWRRKPRFQLGRVRVTRGVRHALSGWQIRRLLNRHARGDWGSGYIGRRSPNERFVQSGLRLDSHYRLPVGDVLITTDPESEVTGKRASTTVYLFGEYSRVHGLE
jgi:hypothetical protein